MRNVYKNMDIFKCVHEAHDGFGSKMSVHYILNNKGCFPGGCFYFNWQCKLMKQGKKCNRSFKFVGKNCTGCRYFYEEKIHSYPELRVSDAEFAAFQSELEEFEDWLELNLKREMEIHGTVDGVKPLFRKQIYQKGEGISFSGFLLIFRELYFERTLMEDHVYARLSPKAFKSLKFGRGDVVTATATLTLDRGRLVLKRLHQIDIEERGEPPLWNESKALVARETATQIRRQPDGCIQCPHGSLIDVEDFRHKETKKYRHLYCLKGREDFLICPDYAVYCDYDPNADRTPRHSASCITRKVNVTARI